MKKPWTKQDIETLYNLKTQKIKDKEIAQILDRTVPSIEKKWHYLKKRKTIKFIDITRCPICQKESTTRKTLTYIDGSSARAYYCSDCLLEFNRKGILEPMLI